LREGIFHSKKSKHKVDKKGLGTLLEEGEGQYVEFKEKLDKRFSREVVAFANASGGKILLGVSDEGAVKGIKDGNEIRSRIHDTAGNCDPSVPISLEALAGVLVVSVAEGRDKPYSCSDGFFMRNTATTIITRSSITTMAAMPMNSIMLSSSFFSSLTVTVITASVASGTEAVIL
jgi:ATP-dependent DNA helicase RecG